MKVRTDTLQDAALDCAVIVALHGKHKAWEPQQVEHFKRLRSGYPLHQRAHVSTNWVDIPAALGLDKEAA